MKYTIGYIKSFFISPAFNTIFDWESEGKKYLDTFYFFKYILIFSFNILPVHLSTLNLLSNYTHFQCLFTLYNLYVNMKISKYS